MAKAKKTNTKKNNDAIVAAEIGAGIIAAGAAVAAGYYFYGAKDAKRHRAAATKWAKGLKDDVVTEAKKLQKLDRRAVGSIVDNAAAAYVGARNVDVGELKRAAQELKANWKELERELTSAGNSAKKATAKSAGAAKKTAKKTAKKVAK